MMILHAQECVHSQALKYGKTTALLLLELQKCLLCLRRTTAGRIFQYLVQRTMGRVLQVITVIATSFEFLLATSLLALFASAYPDQFRTALWRDGGSKGWNSDPSDRIYLYANYEEVPPMPLIWDEGYASLTSCVHVHG